MDKSRILGIVSAVTMPIGIGLHALGFNIMTIIVGILSTLFVGFFVAFILEWIEESRDNKMRKTVATTIVRYHYRSIEAINTSISAEINLSSFRVSIMGTLQRYNEIMQIILAYGGLFPSKEIEKVQTARTMYRDFIKNSCLNMYNTIYKTNQTDVLLEDIFVMLNAFKEEKISNTLIDKTHLLNALLISVENAWEIINKYKLYEIEEHQRMIASLQELESKHIGNL